MTTINPKTSFTFRERNAASIAGHLAYRDGDKDREDCRRDVGEIASRH
jgi:hypothetical protein